MTQSRHAIAITDEVIINQIYYVRGNKVMQDRDLAKFYGVETKQLKRLVSRGNNYIAVPFRRR
jgi:hypothetical protein